VTRLRALFDTSLVDDGFAGAIALVAQNILMSPHFLYRVEFGGPAVSPKAIELTDYEMASRLSYFLWSSMPDAQLFTAASGGELHTPQQIEVQARRMLSNPKARAKVARFHASWLQLDRLATLTKDPSVFPTFSDALKPDLRAETEAFVDYVFWQDGGKAQQLLEAPYTFVSPALAELYEVSPPLSGQFEKVTLDTSKRMGLLTQSSFLALNGKVTRTDPVHRGKFIRTQLMCQELAPPPGDVESLAKEDRTVQPCVGCHRLMDPIGQGLENYDGVGRWRITDEQGAPVNANGEVVATPDADGPFVGGPALSQRLAQSELFTNCVATRWFRASLGRQEAPEDKCSAASLKKRFAAAGYDMRELLVQLTQLDSFRYRAPLEGVSP
jgi:hypothetical protein